MRKNVWLIAALSLVIAPAYAGSALTKKTTQPSVLSTKKINLPAFTDIDAEGYFKVVLVSDRFAKTPRVSETTYTEEPIEASVKGKTLVLRGAWLPAPGLNQEPVVTIRTNNVERITLAGPTDLSGKNVRSKNGVHLFSTGSGQVHFWGNAVLVDSIRQVGNATINIQWAKSNVLHMAISRGVVNLAGAVKQVYARVLGDAKLNAMYLRASNVSIQTADRAVARVSANDDLRAFASGFSNVFYYKDPKHMTRGTLQSGNVLQMAWRQ